MSLKYEPASEPLHISVTNPLARLKFTVFVFMFLGENWWIPSVFAQDSGI